jgi:hypothetical protein
LSAEFVEEANKKISPQAAWLAGFICKRERPPGRNLTQWVRSWNGADAVVDKSSGAYFAGEITGGVVGTSLLSAGGATAAAIADGKNGAYFERAINNPLFNGDALNKSRLRFGWN